MCNSIGGGGTPATAVLSAHFCCVAHLSKAHSHRQAIYGLCATATQQTAQCVFMSRDHNLQLATMTMTLANCSQSTHSKSASIIILRLLEWPGAIVRWYFVANDRSRDGRTNCATLRARSINCRRCQVATHKCTIAHTKNEHVH